MEASPPARIRQPRLADLVASLLRERIVSGELADGDIIGPQDDLLAEFGVSKPSMREALRILETEGLITVLRGNRGGAVVHAAGAQTAAHAIDLVLRSQEAKPQDVAVALSRLESVCAALCAERADRATTAVPALEAAQRTVEECVGDAPRFQRAARSFHDEVARACGNITMAVLVAALDSVGSGPAEAAAGARLDQPPGPPQRSEAALAHRALIELIAAGDSAGAERAARLHLAAARCRPG